MTEMHLLRSVLLGGKRGAGFYRPPLQGRHIRTHRRGLFRRCAAF